MLNKILMRSRNWCINDRREDKEVSKQKNGGDEKRG